MAYIQAKAQRNARGALAIFHGSRPRRMMPLGLGTSPTGRRVGCACGVLT